jgi:hypothetical protein
MEAMGRRLPELLCLRLGLDWLASLRVWEIIPLSLQDLMA